MQPTEIEWMAFQLQFLSIDLGVVQDVIDDGQQSISAILNGLQEVALLRLQIRPQEQAGHAYDGIHGRADLVAHIGQEFRFCSGERLRSLLGDLEVPVGGLEFRGAMPHPLFQLLIEAYDLLLCTFSFHYLLLRTTIKLCILIQYQDLPDDYKAYNYSYAGRKGGKG